MRYSGNQVAAGGKQCRTCTGAQCTRCAAAGDNDCLECEQKHFLQILDKKAQTGKCVAKLTTADRTLDFDLYVSNLLDESKVEARQRNGTYEDPFAQLADAFVRVRELAAPFTPNVRVTVHLFKGAHYAVENRFDALNIYVEKEAIDAHALNRDIHIKPLSCGKTKEGTAIAASVCAAEDEQVVIYNKMRERFAIEVHAKLKMERVVIDSLDSILPFGTPCLSEYRPCCKIEGATLHDPGVTDYDTSRPERCAEHFKKLKLTDECQVGEPRTMFKFVANDDAQYYSDFRANELQLVHSVVRHVFYGMNSLFNLTAHGGRLIVTDSTITRINICGSIVKNKYVHSNNMDLGNIDSSYLSSAEKDWIERSQ